MGLLNKLFGGGTKLELKLDADQIPEGGLLSGTLLLHGGKKPLEVDALKIRLVYVNVETVEGQSMPNIELKTLIDNTIASNEDLPPGALKKFSFTLTVPKGTDPDGTYKVMAVADIPKVADPTAEADLKVVPTVERGFFGGAKGPGAITADDLFHRFPGLRSTSDEAIRDALHELHMAIYDPDQNLIAAEPLLARFMREGSERVRERALSVWGTLLNNRARPEHIQALEAMAADPSLSTRLLREVTEVAAKFAEEGALPLVKRLVEHPDPEVRASMATQLYLNADPDLAERRELLLRLARDPEGEVRAAAFAAFSSFASDAAIVELCAHGLETDGSPDVQKACIRALSPAHYYGHTDLVMNTFLRHLDNPHVEVREEIAESCHWLPQDPRVGQLVGSLLNDESVEVRRKMAWQSVNMSDHPELAALFVRAATQDPSIEVRADALHGLTRLMPVGDAVALYRERKDTDQSEATGYGIVNGLRDALDEPPARALMEEMTRYGYSRVAGYARDCLENR